jgi:hypothetical protein
VHNFNFDTGILTIYDDKKRQQLHHGQQKTAVALNKDRQFTRLYISLKHLPSDPCLD